MSKVVDGREPEAGEEKRPPLLVLSKTTSIPKSYAVQYVAMLTDERTIVAVDRTSKGARRKATEAGYPDVAVAWIPPGRTIGC